MGDAEEAPHRKMGSVADNLETRVSHVHVSPAMTRSRMGVGMGPKLFRAAGAPLGVVAWMNR